MKTNDNLPMNNQTCNCSGGCGSGIERRDFLKLAAWGAAASLVPAMPIMAGPFETSDFEKLIPTDKKLDPAWIKSLTARGAATVYRGAELEKIGMPVGGICAGQLYLGGDGKLWHWDIFNQYIGTADGNYANPPKPSSPLEQGFGVRILRGEKTSFHSLDRAGFSEITFCGEYPMATVEYRDPAVPLAVTLEAFSPFVPLNTDDSSLPASVMGYSLKNTSREKVEVEIFGWLQNAVNLHTAHSYVGKRRNRIRRDSALLALDCTAAEDDLLQNIKPRENILFDDFSKETYEGWEATGDAFGDGPILKANVPAYQGDVGSKATRVVNSHSSAPGESVEAKDAKTGTLTSKTFVIERNFINFWIGGGDHPGKTCINLLIDGKTVLLATGHNSNAMRQASFDVRKLQGKTARLQIVDQETGAWGNIGIAEIVLSDKPSEAEVKFVDQFDFGTMALGLLEPRASDLAAASLSTDKIGEGIPAGSNAAAEPFDKTLLGGLGRRMTLEPGQTATATFVITWNFPNLRLKDGGRHYAVRFRDAADVANYLAKNYASLAGQTRLWRDTWLDSTLPHWFLERTFANTSTLATSTSFRFKNGRFYGWEGVGCCEGTCTHVWHYAHAVARLFPELERDLRRRTDFGTAMDPQTGVINHRGESAGLAVDGQAGCILRAYREHQMSADGEFLKELWPKVKKAMQMLVSMDGGDGILIGAQHNTLDQPWFGKVAWLSSLYLAAARACEEMAREMNDDAFAAQMREIFERGRKNLDRELFNGEYYLQIPDKEHARSVGSHNGCEIDQVFGSSWARQVGLGEIVDEGHVKKALAALWKYNFTPDVGPFRQRNKPGRWYAMAGEGGLIMCTWPQGDAARLQSGFDFYFNECMSGFEYQVAGHMIWEGMVQEGLAIVRAIHDRYHASRRNPWNEVECGDHYARAMASYGVFLAACGYEHHGPKGYLAFAPKISPDEFRAPFTTAEGWGTFSQRRENGEQRETIEVKYGKLRVQTLAFTVEEGANPKSVRMTVGGKTEKCSHRLDGRRIVIELAASTSLTAGRKMEISIG